MRCIVVLAVAGLMILPGLTWAQPNTDTLTILESTTMMWDSQLVDYFVMDVGDGAEDLWFMFVEDSAYVWLIGFVQITDTTMLTDPIIWMKTNNPTVGDSWEGMMPSDGILPTQEEIVGTKTVNVGAGSILVYEISVSGLDGTYWGEKWYADGIGLVGWDVSICNTTEMLELLDYNLAPSSDFWPHDVGNEWVIQTQSSQSQVTADFATLTMDGDPSDWAGITAITQDPAGDDSSGYSGNDIRDLYAAADATNLYLMVDFWDGRPDTVWGLANGLAYVFVFQDSDTTFWGLALSYTPGFPGAWFVAGVNISASGTVVAVDSVIEIAVPLTNLGFLSTQLPDYSVAVGGGLYDVSCSNTVLLPGYCPIAVPGDVQGSSDVNLTDVIYIVNYVLKAGPTPVPCEASGDVNCNGVVNLTDVTYLVNYVLKAGPPPCDICSTIPGLWTCP